MAMCHLSGAQEDEHGGTRVLHAVIFMHIVDAVMLDCEAYVYGHTLSAKHSARYICMYICIYRQTQVRVQHHINVTTCFSTVHAPLEGSTV